MGHRACTFFGHRDCPASVRPRLREVLVELVEHYKVDMFYVGSQGNFDALVRSALRELKEEYPRITYWVVLAYLPRQSRKSDPRTILPEGIEAVPKRFAISWRNRWMLQRVGFVVAYVLRPWGGAAQFVGLARRKGKEVWNLAFPGDFSCSEQRKSVL